MPLACVIFETPIGICGIVWSGVGLAGVHLPEPSEAAAHGALLRRFPGATSRAARADRAGDRADQGASWRGADRL